MPRPRSPGPRPRTAGTRRRAHGGGVGVVGEVRDEVDDRRVVPDHDEVALAGVGLGERAQDHGGVDVAHAVVQGWVHDRPGAHGSAGERELERLERPRRVRDDDRAADLGERAAVLGPLAQRGRLGPTPRRELASVVAARRGALCLGVPHDDEAAHRGSSSRDTDGPGRGRSVAAAHAPPLVLPRDRHRPAAGRHRAVPRLEPRPRRHPPGPARLERPRRPAVRVRVLLPCLPRGTARRHRRRPPRLLLARLASNRRRVLHGRCAPGARRRPTSGSPGSSSSRRSPSASWGSLRAQAARALRQAARRVDLPHDQRRAPAVRRARPTPDARDRRYGSAARPRTLAVGDDEAGGFRHLDTLSYPRGTAIGSTQILALFAGISRSGITMVAG